MIEEKLAGLEIVKTKSREEWLKKRGDSGRIGGSEAASTIGLNPWASNVELWEIKTGRRKRMDVSDLHAVEYGRDAEEHIRELFKLDFPGMAVFHEEHAYILNPALPWALASVDGLLIEKDTGKLGVLEIKTSAILGAAQRKKWDGRIPDNYFCQVLHYMAVLRADFAILAAQLSYGSGDDLVKVTRHYRIEREDVEPDIAALMKAEAEFYEAVKMDKPPALILPEI